MSFKFELGQEVNIVTRGINATIVGRSEYGLLHWHNLYAFTLNKERSELLDWIEEHCLEEIKE